MNSEKFPQKKFLFVSLESLSGDLAWNVLREGHQVKAWIKEKGDADVYNGFFEKVADWKKFVDWADVIVFDDIEFGPDAEKLRKAGKLVVGGSVYTDKLEMDRQFGQAELKKFGVNILPYWTFKSYDEAIEFIKKNPEKYVFKPHGNTPSGGKGLLFISLEDDGKDLLAMLQQNKEMLEKKAPEFQLQKYISGVEVAVGAFFNGKDFLYPINVNFEHKKMFPGDIGPLTGEMGTLMFWSAPNKLFNETLGKMKTEIAKSGYVGYIDINCIVNGKGIYPLEWTCFDEKTEILTRDGWKNYSEVKAGDFTLAINPKTRELGWKKIINKAIMNYEGDMVKIGAKGKSHSAADILVTPEHRLLVLNDNHPRFHKAGELKAHWKIIRTGEWHCATDEFVAVPEYIENHWLGRYKKSMEISHPEKKIRTEDFMKFLGLYLAEGSFGGRGHFINIAQSPKSNRRREIEDILDKINFKYTAQKSGAYQISSVQLCKFFKGLELFKVKSGDKFVPQKFKEFAPKFLKALIHGFALGDGCWHKRTGQLSLATTSKKLSDDLQEIIIKCGQVTNIRKDLVAGTKGIGGYKRKNDIYSLSIRGKKMDYYLDSRVVGRENYKGKVWDVEVEDWHTMLVRRNGKPFFSGNCRFGYPTIEIQQEGIQTPMGEFLYRMAAGENFEIKTKKGFQIGIRIFVPTYFAKNNDIETMETYRDLPILFKNPNDLGGIHIEDIKNDNGVWRIAGTSGVLLVIASSGQTVEEARSQVYNRVKNIIIPNMFYRLDVGGRWVNESDKLQTWGYLNT